MKQESWYLTLATLGPVGYLPAPGTMATMVTLPLVYLARSTMSEIGYLGFIAASIALGYYVIHHAMRFFLEPDPSAIVFDELIGTLIAFIAIPLSWPFLLCGFICFRFFDISKIGGIHFSERLPGAFGIIADDILAALVSNVILHLILRYGIL